MDELAYIALGSNLGDRRGAIEGALRALGETPAVAVTAVSDIIETDPVGPPGQGAYLNAVVRLRTSLTPRELLELCRRLETTGGRDRNGEQRWGPRRLDLDLLLYGHCVVNEPDLVVPHPLMHRRDFVLRPLAQIAPEAMHPVLNATVESLLDRLDGPGPVEYAGDRACS